MDTIKPAHYTIHHNLNAIKAIKKGWDITILRWPTYMLVTLVLIIMSFIIGFIPLIGYFLAVFMGLYIISLMLDIYEKNKEDPKLNFDKYIKFLGTNLLVALIACGPMFILVSIWGLYAFLVSAKGVDVNVINSATNTFSAVTTIIPILMGLSILLSLYMIIRLSFAQYLVVDKNINPLQAVKKSWQITRGNMWEVIYLFIIFFIMMIAGALCIGIGLLFVLPVIYFATIDAYKQMIGEAKH